MIGINLLFDGITVQYSGELLFNKPEKTWPLRGICYRNYRRSLEDFAFGAIFCGTIVTMDKLPNVLHAKPGEHLLTHWFSEKHNRLSEVPTQVAQPRSHMEAGERDAIKEFIGELSGIPYEGKKYWHDLVVKEAYLYFGNDASLQKPSLGGDYKFSWQERVFIRNKELQDAIDPNFVKPLVKAVREGLRGIHKGIQGAHNDALREFVKRIVVEHIRIYYKRARQRDALLLQKNPVWLPHCSRQSLVPIDTQMSQIAALVMPGLMERMISKSAASSKASNRRTELLKRLVEASLNPGYDGFRQKLSEAYYHAARGNSTALGNLRSDLSRQVDDWGPSKRSIWSLVYAKFGRPYEKAVAKLIRAGAGPQYGTEEWSKVFPELWGNKPERRTFLYL
jgi:hypothetical protein